MDMPWENNDAAAKQDCYTNLMTAIISAKVDIRQRIKDLEKEIELLKQAELHLSGTNSTTVKKIKAENFRL